MANFSVTQIEQMIEQLQAKQKAHDVIQEEVQKDIVDIVRDRLEYQWSQIAEGAERDYEISLEKYQKLVLLEFAIIESARGYISDDLLSNVAKVFERIRISDDLRHMKSVYPSVAGKEGEEKNYILNVRNSMKLLSNVYRYNRDLLFGKKSSNSSTQKSSIRYASACDHCGEVAKKILDNMIATGAVQLP